MNRELPYTNRLRVCDREMKLRKFTIHTIALLLFVLLAFLVSHSAKLLPSRRGPGGPCSRCHCSTDGYGTKWVADRIQYRSL